VFASGSWDGVVRLWKVDSKLRSFEALATVPAVGIVNSVQLVAPSLRPEANKVSQKGAKEDKRLLVVASVGKEPRLGRWMRQKEAKDGAVVAVIPFE